MFVVGVVYLLYCWCVVGWLCVAWILALGCYLLSVFVFWLLAACLLLFADLLLCAWVASIVICLTVSVLVGGDGCFVLPCGGCGDFMVYTL